MRGRVLVIAGIAALAAATPARAATYTVTGTSDGTGSCDVTTCTTLRAAVSTADETEGADTIELGARTYDLSQELAVGTDITVTGVSADTTKLREDGKSGRVFNVGTGGKLTVQHATLANGFTAGHGGNVLAAAGTELVLDHVRVTGGSSSTAGGIFVGAGASARISHSLVDGNQATGEGGGIVAVGSARLAPVGITLSITDSTVTGNTASSSAGIVVRGDARNATMLTRSTVAGNSASTNGGAAGIFVADAEGFTATGSIISGNTGDGVPLNCAGALTSGGGNVDSGGSCGLATATDRQNTDPVLGSLTPGLGETPVLPITALSPAVDLTPIKDAACTGTDQRDLPRPQGGGCDAGAYEVDQAPDTTIDSGDSGTIATPSNTFTFSSTEPGVTFECKLDGPGATMGVFDACTSATGYGRLPDGTYTFSVRAVDGTGNTDPSPATRTFTVDTTPPDTSTTGPSGATNNSSPSFSFTSPEGTATFQCELDGPGATTGSFVSCTSPKAYSALADGTYTFSVRALDAVGNADASPATRTFTVDTAAPDTTIGGGPTGTTNDTSASFSLISTEDGSTFECKLDRPGAPGTFASCTSPQSYGPLADGTYTFSLRATDAAGNTDPTPATRTFTVDTTRPDTSITSGPSGTIAGGTASFGFSSPDGTATFQCALDGPGTSTGSFAACASPKGYTGLADGSYTFRVRAVDRAGNADAGPAARSFMVDTSPPEASIVSGPSGETADVSPSFTFSAAEADATFDCRLDGPSGGGTFGACTSPKHFTDLAPGDYTFFVRARDAAGNETVTSRSFTVEQPSPPSGPTPQPRETVVVTPVKGRVLIKLPGTNRFVPLDASTGIPLGSSVDTLRGRVQLSAIRKAGKPLEAARFYGGIFKVTQTSSVTQLRLVQRLSCAAPAKKAEASRKRVRKRRLWGNGHGRFRTKGQYSSATVRGTKWLVQDSCDKTVTRVARGVVAVRDFVRHRTVRVRAGHSYTARKR